MLQNIKNIIKKILAEIVYEMHCKGLLSNPLKVHTIDETLDALLNTNKSLVRFGDSDIVVLSGKKNCFQTTSPEIRESLKRILGYHYEDLIVCLPDVFDGLGGYIPKSQLFWKDHLLFFRRAYYKFCDVTKIYYNSFVTRSYMIFNKKRQSEDWFAKFREVFRDKDIVIVEGCTTHNGVGNDLLSHAKSVKRIIGPSRNAYSVRDKILTECLKYDKDKLFLLSLGSAAKELAESLFLQGYRVLDIGNLDMEYEWFLQKAQTKVPLEKHQIVGEENNRNAGYHEYLEQIVCYIEAENENPSKTM